MRAYILGMRAPLLAALAALPLTMGAAGPVRAAEPGSSFTTLAFTTQVAGLSVMATEADVELDATGYRIDIATRTVGAFGLVMRGETRSLAQGRWAGTMAAALVAPQRYAVDGAWRGTPRRTLMEYAAGQPTLLRLEPANDTEREPVPPDLQRETIDTISAAALLARRATTTGRCDGEARTYDGRRLFEVAVRSGGWEILPPQALPISVGPTLRCDFEGRLLAGFPRDADRESVARPQLGTAWLARLSPGAPLLPVRMRFDMRWMGSATMTLTAATQSGAPLVRQRADAALAPPRR